MDADVAVRDLNEQYVETLELEWPLPEAQAMALARIAYAQGYETAVPERKPAA